MIHNYNRLLEIALPRVPDTHKTTVLGDVAGHKIFLISPKNVDSHKPNFLIVAGTHGNEVGGPWGLVKFLATRGLQKHGEANISLIPVINPDAFNRNTRYDRWEGPSNQGFLEDMPPSQEGRILKAHSGVLIRLAREGFLTLHESPERDGYYFYLYSRDMDTVLREQLLTAAAPIPMLKDGLYHSKFEGYYEVSNGCVLNIADGSFEHFLFTQGVPLCVTSETPMKYVNLDIRIAAITRIINAFLERAEYRAKQQKADWVGEFMKYSAEKVYKFDRDDAWGYCLSMDLNDCDPATIRDPLAIQLYVGRLCEMIDSIPYGPPQIVRFGKDNKFGYSFVQLVTTSSITGHFSEDKNAGFIDIFYCKVYDPQKALDFTRDFFRARVSDIRLFTRD